jgi:hypothetical protein
MNSLFSKLSILTALATHGHEIRPIIPPCRTSSLSCNNSTSGSFTQRALVAVNLTLDNVVPVFFGRGKVTICCAKGRERPEGQLKNEASKRT